MNVGSSQVSNYLLKKYKFQSYLPQFGVCDVMKGQNFQLFHIFLKSDCLFGFSDDFPTWMQNFRNIHVKPCQKLRLAFPDFYGKYEILIFFWKVGEE